jgi:alcohol dehydrogenase class IV
LDSIDELVNSGMGTSSLDQPSRVIFGLEAANQLPIEIRKLTGGEAKAFVVCDKFLASSNEFKTIIQSLNSNGIETEIFDKVDSEPKVEAVDAMISTMRGHDFTCVVGIGGGSALDRAKFAAVIYPNGGNAESYLTLEPHLKKKPLPKILMPTTAGTGSEVSTFAVAIGRDRVKRFLQGHVALADVAIIDPNLTLSCPSKVTAGSGMDVLGTSIEAMLSKKATSMSDTLSLTAIRLVGKHLRRAVEVGSDIHARYHMSLAAMYGGLAVNTPAACNISHCIAEILGPMLGVPHGIAVAITTPYGMSFNLPACKQKMMAIAEALAPAQNASPDQAAQIAIGAVNQLVKDIGLPSSFGHASLDHGKLDELANFILNTQQYAYDLPNINPMPLTFQNVRNLLAQVCS